MYSAEDYHNMEKHTPNAFNQSIKMLHTAHSTHFDHACSCTFSIQHEQYLFVCKMLLSTCIVFVVFLFDNGVSGYMFETVLSASLKKIKRKRGQKEKQDEIPFYVFKIK